MAMVTACCFYLSACASIGFGGAEEDIDTTATSSIGSNPAILAGIDPSDWQMLLQTVGELETRKLTSEQSIIAWVNPETGSKGEITDISAHQSVMDEECRSFKSSMHRITGVENVAGEMCRNPKGGWEMTGFSSGSAA
jgi:surface antigen